jgi:hypothetical protein
VPRYDLTLNEKARVRFGAETTEVQFGDGVQVWLNPRFAHATSLKALRAA